MKKIISTVVLIFGFLLSNGQNIGIGTNNPQPSAVLDITDTTKTYRNCTIGHWTSEEDYKTIHDHPKFKAWANKNKDNNAVFITGQLYRKFYAAD